MSDAHEGDGYSALVNGDLCQSCVLSGCLTFRPIAWKKQSLIQMDYHGFALDMKISAGCQKATETTVEKSSLRL